MNENSNTEARAREHFAQHKYARLYRAVAFAEQYPHAIDAVENLMAEFATQEVQREREAAVREFDRRIKVQAPENAFREMFPTADL